MKHNLSNIALLILVISACMLPSCDRPECTNTNPVFSRYNPADEMYKRELAKQIKQHRPLTLRYWIKEYQQRANEEYLLVNIQNKKLCAEMLLHVTSWQGMEHVGKVKAKTYSGAELEGLKYHVVNNNGETDFVYESVYYIID